jgi:hypothetical protein
MLGSTTFSSSASFMSSCPAILTNGNSKRFLAAASAAVAAAWHTARLPMRALRSRALPDMA